MQAIIFDNQGRKIESLLLASQESLKNYFMYNDEADRAVFIENDQHLQNELILIDTRIDRGYYEEQTKVITISGVFNFDHYQGAEFIDDIPENIFKINENLIHIYNGGSIESVPYPMPYSIDKVIEKEEFVILERLENLIVYTRENILNS
jgi:hypothetical protein